MLYDGDEVFGLAAFGTMDRPQWDVLIWRRAAAEAARPRIARPAGPTPTCPDPVCQQVLAQLPAALKPPTWQELSGDGWCPRCRTSFPR